MVLSCRPTDSQTDADKRFTSVTLVGVSNKLDLARIALFKDTMYIYGGVQKELLSSKSQRFALSDCLLCLCPVQSQVDSPDEFHEDVTFAPKDICPVNFEAKNNYHGIGYRGLDPGSALGHTGLAESTSVTASGRRGIRGQVSHLINFAL